MLNRLLSLSASLIEKQNTSAFIQPIAETRAFQISKPELARLRDLGDILPVKADEQISSSPIPFLRPEDAPFLDPRQMIKRQISKNNYDDRPVPIFPPGHSSVSNRSCVENRDAKGEQIPPVPNDALAKFFRHTDAALAKVYKESRDITEGIAGEENGRLVLNWDPNWEQHDQANGSVS